ncbi:MAG: hypothetical protein H6581_29455 [Bacteroidia bacterium]|nr:hypothetical protein [Bacteroidia bacterium]
MGDLQFRKDRISWLDQVIGHSFFAVLLVFSVVFFRERIGFYDTSNYLYNILSTGEFNTPHHRFSAFFTQLIPFFLIKQGASLKWVMIGYSVNFILVSYACFLFVLKVCRNLRAAYAILLFQVLSVMHLFFWPVSEMFQGLVWALAFFGWWTSPRFIRPWLRAWVGILLILVTVFAHSIMAIPLVFILLFDLADRRDWKNKKQYLLFALALGSLLLFRFLKGENNYEKQRTDAIFSIWEILPVIFGQNGTKVLWNYLSGDFVLLKWCFFGLLGMYALLGKWLKLALFGLFQAGYFFIVVMAYPNGESYLIIENLILPFGFIQALAFCWDGMEFLGNLRVSRLVWLVLIVISVFRIGEVVEQYRWRTEWYEVFQQNIRQFPERKFVMLEENHPRGIVPINWPVFAEGMFFSGLQSPDSVFNLYVAKQGGIREILDKPNPENLYLKVPWWVFNNYSSIPKPYFHLPEGKFHYLNPPDTLSPDSLKSILQACEIRLVSLGRRIQPNRRDYVLLEILHQGAGHLPSSLQVPHPATLTYRLYHNGNEMGWEDPKIPLQADVYARHLQQFPVKLPKFEGEFKLEFVLQIPSLDSLEVVSEQVEFRNH